MENIENTYENPGIKPYKNIGYAMIIATLLSLSNFTSAKTTTVTSGVKESIEQVISPDIVDNVTKRTGVKLPAGYEEKVRDFVNQCDLLKDAQLAKITEDFIVAKMNKNLGIDKKNQEVFYWTICSGLLVGKDVYPGPGEDDNTQMAEDFKIVLPILTDDLHEYSDITISRIATLTYTDLDALVQLYNSFKENPQSVSQSDIDIAKQKLKELIPICEQFDIDYQKKLSPAQEFYGI